MAKVLRRPRRTALGPKGIAGQRVDERTTRALSGPEGDVEETVRRIGRATRRKDVEFVSRINPLSGRIISMTRGERASTTPLPSRGETRIMRRRAQLLERDPDLAERYKGLYGVEPGAKQVPNRHSSRLAPPKQSSYPRRKDGAQKRPKSLDSGPQPIMVHNHPELVPGDRRAHSASDLMAFFTRQSPTKTRDSRVVSLASARAGDRTVPRTRVHRIRRGTGSDKARDAVTERVSGLDYAHTVGGSRKLLDSTVRQPPLVRRMTSGSARVEPKAEKKAKKTVRAMFRSSGSPRSDYVQMARRPEDVPDNPVSAAFKANGEEMGERAKRGYVAGLLGRLRGKTYDQQSHEALGERNAFRAEWQVKKSSGRVLRRPRRAVLGPKGVPGQRADDRTLRALSGPEGDVEETVRRVGRATRRQNVEFNAEISPLSGRLVSMTRGVDTETSHMSGGAGHLKIRRRRRQILRNNPELAQRYEEKYGVAPGSGRIPNSQTKKKQSSYSEKEFTRSAPYSLNNGPALINVHNHPRGLFRNDRDRAAHSSADVHSLVRTWRRRRPTHDSRVVSLTHVRQGDKLVPRTKVHRVRRGRGSETARSDVAERLDGIDLASSVGEGQIAAAVSRKSPLSRIAEGRSPRRSLEDEKFDEQDARAMMRSRGRRKDYLEAKSASVSPQPSASLLTRSIMNGSPAGTKDGYVDGLLGRLRGKSYDEQAHDALRIGNAFRSDWQVKKSASLRRATAGIDAFVRVSRGL